MFALLVWPAAPPASTCPYHGPILSPAGHSWPASDQLPMTRFTECVSSELPFTILAHGAVGTATSGGCNCAGSTTLLPDALAEELETMIGRGETEQP